MTTTTVWTRTQRRSPLRDLVRDLAALEFHYRRLLVLIATGKDLA